MYSLLLGVAFSGLISQTYAVCQSYGTDFVDGGSYCIDPRLTDVFSFGTSWSGCSASDSQNGVDPYLSDPNGDGRYCSTIQTNPDGQAMISTCNVDGDPLTKNNMITGNYTVGLYGLTFAYQREFFLKVQIPATVISTPTVSFTITSTPSTTVTSTTTGTDTTTLAPVTTTVPSTTITFTSTKTPARVTTTTTSTILIPIISWSFSKTTTTSTWTCPGINPRQDPKATSTPSRVASALASASAAGGRTKRGRVQAGWGFDKIWPRAEAPAANLAKRTPDLCTSTVLGTSAISTTITSTAPVSTIVVPTAVTVTATITPPPVTAYSGKAKTTTTTTLPTATRTVTRYTIAYTVTTKTIWATVTARATVAPPGKVCNWAGKW